ncbi:hypothetical protein ACGFYV_32365, partial [Streptomyces sp. NPDC048297]|uniref:hypothetical protein n=1 Tax=Streptomyces sp. NPDC048297 TaxID=3365531 RepID=UPI00371DF103
MTAEHEDAAGVDGAGRNAEPAHAEHEDVEYGGMDALMAAITGDPLPPAARQDPGFRAEHRAAEADVAVLRHQLTWLAEALTGEPMTGQPMAGATPGEPTAAPTGEDDAAATAPAEKATPPGSRPRSVTRPAGQGRPGRSPRPGRPSGRRRALRIAFGTFAGSAALGMVFGFAYLVSRPGGVSASSGAADAKSAEQGAAVVSGDGGRPEDPVQALACYRLVVEGTVAAVERKPDTPGARVVLTVTRSYQPA